MEYSVLRTAAWIAAFALMSAHSMAIASPPNVNVIYGDDNRKDLYDVVNPNYKKWADSTVVLIKKDDLAQNSSGVLQINARSFKDVMGVCEKERFSAQPAGGFCSGSLIGKNLILTAGHCIQNQEACASTSFVFNYAVNQAGVYPRDVAENNVYHCSSVIHTQQVGGGADYAIVQVSRDVTNHEPLKLARGRLQKEIEAGTKLVMIGHPAGLPTKIDDGAKVRDATPSGYFIANTDSYGGNSGSAVLNQVSGEIEGVLVRGERDYVYTDDNCYISNVCAEDGCRGEDITKVSAVIPSLPN